MGVRVRFKETARFMECYESRNGIYGMKMMRMTGNFRRFFAPVGRFFAAAGCKNRAPGCSFPARESLAQRGCGRGRGKSCAGPGERARKQARSSEGRGAAGAAAGTGGGNLEELSGERIGFEERGT